MMDKRNLPPARERNKYGLRSYTENPPAAAEALFDRVGLRVRGTITARDAAALDDFAQQIGSAITPSPLFGTPTRWRGSWRAKAIKGTTASRGEISIARVAPIADFEIELVLNPIRTLAHLLDRFEFQEIATLDPFEFFAASPAPSACDLTLDGTDNMVPDYRAFAGTVYTTYLQRVAEYLSTFEDALRERLLLELCPRELGYEHETAGLESFGRSNELEVKIDWGSVAVSQAEVCWERHDPEALEKAMALSEQLLEAARSVKVDTYKARRGPSVARERGAASATVPLVPSGKAVLVAYAKAADRLRIEVRYLRDVGDRVRGALPARPTLLDWLNALAADASSRVQRGFLCALSQAPQHPDAEALADLLQAVADATEQAKRKRRSLFLQLIRHGAITATGERGDSPASIMERLVSRGVLEHVRLVAQDHRIGRRYRLTSRYRGLTRLV